MLYSINITKHDIIFHYQFQRYHTVLRYFCEAVIPAIYVQYKDGVKYYYAIYIVIFFCVLSA